MIPVKVVFLGCTKFSKAILDYIIEKNLIKIEAIFTIPEQFNISYSKEQVKNTNYADLHTFAKSFKIPVYTVDSEDEKKLIDYKHVFELIKPDVILVMGWYYMVPKQVRVLAKHGAWGIHASLLPDYAGGAPLVWAIIEGQKETGVTLFRLGDGVDDGEIIMQKKFEIKMNDTIAHVYKKATKASKNILKKSLLNIENILYLPQDKAKIKIYPQRKPEDGEINLEWDAKRIYNFIRAQSHPYPGAFIKTKDGKKVVIEKAHIEDV